MKHHYNDMRYESEEREGTANNKRAANKVNRWLMDDRNTIDGKLVIPYVLDDSSIYDDHFLVIENSFVFQRLTVHCYLSYRIRFRFYFVSNVLTLI